MRNKFILVFLLLMNIHFIYAKSNVLKNHSINKSTIYIMLTMKNGYTLLGTKEGLKVLHNKNFQVPTFKAKKNMSIYTISEQEDGKIIIGGNFDTVNGHKIKDIVRLNMDGSIDDSFMSDFDGFDGEIYDIEILKDHSILVGGYFTKLGHHTTSKGLVKLNENGSIAVEYHDLTHYLISIVNDIDIVNNKIFLAGIFIKNKNEQQAILSVDKDGNLNKKFNQKVSAIQGNTFKIAVNKNNLVLIGDLSIKDNNVVSNVVKLNINGTINEHFHISGLSGFLYDVKYKPNTLMFAGELFIETKNKMTEVNLVQYTNNKLIPLLVNNKTKSYTLDYIKEGK